MSTTPMCQCGCGGPGDCARGMCAAAYKRDRRRQIAYGRWQSRYVYVPADAARAHIQRLAAAGLRPAQVALIAGINRATITHIVTYNAARVTAAVEAAILAVPVPVRPASLTAPNAQVPVHGARRRIQALIAHGHSRSQLARELGLDPVHNPLGAILGTPEHASRFISAERDDAIKALFDRLQMIPGTSRWARDMGKKQGWPLPFEWDEDAIDDPNGTPVQARWSRADARADRRMQVRQLTDDGLTPREIADQLGVHPVTVERDQKVNHTTTGKELKTA